MPRSYISVEDGKTTINTTEDGAFSGSALEASVLGNTDFDAINNPITAFNFVLEVEGLYFLPIKSVRAFTKENEFEYIREGGLNDYVHLKRKPISKPFTFQIERYVGTERFLDPLANGTELVLPLVLYVYRHKARSGLTQSAPEWPARVYTFTGCTVMSKEYGGLDAEKSGLLTETTTIAYRELVVLTNPFQASSEAEEWNPKKDPSLYKKSGPGALTKYAATSPNDKEDSGTYWYEWVNEDNVTQMRMKDDAPYPFRSAAWDGDPKNSKRPKKAGPDVLGETYEQGTVDGKQTLVRKDSSDFNRPAYSFADDGSKPKYAQQSPVDMNTGEKIYDKDAKGNVKRIDHAENNKPEWTGAKDTKVAWAAQAAPDKAGNTYSVTKKDGNKVVKRKDSGQFNAGAYNISKDKSKNKRAQVSSIDKNAASPIYKQEKGHTVRKDNSDVNKGAYNIAKDRNVSKYANEAKNSMARPEAGPAYSIGEDGTTTRYAQEASTSHDKPEARAPYKISDGSAPKYAAKSPKDGQKAEAKQPYKIGDGSAAKYAAKSPKDSEKPEARGPYKISDGSGAKFAATSPKDGEKPEARAPYSIKADGAKPKYAVPSPTNKPLQTPVTWPPTRRALMAENLKK